MTDHTLVAPEWLSEEGLQTLSSGYLLPGETPRSMFERVASKAAQLNEDDTLEDDLFECLWKGWIGLASPVSANFGTNRALPISCFSIHISDDTGSIYSHKKEAAMLSKNGGGVGVWFGDIRPSGAPIKGGGKSSGLAGWMQGYDHDARIVSQGGVRRGSFALYTSIDHPDFPEILETKDHTKGDPRHWIDSNIAVTIPDSFMIDMIENGGHNQELFGETIRARLMSGSPYMVFIDNVNRLNPPCYKERGLNVSLSNLCFTGDTLVAVADGRNSVPISELEGSTFPVYSARPRLGSSGKPVKQWVPEIKQAVAFCTGEREVVEVELEDGSTFRCTPDHLLALRDTTWVEAQDSVGSVLEPFTSRVNSYRTDKSFHSEYAKATVTGKSNPKFCGIDNYELIELGKQVYEKLGYFSRAAYLSLREEGYNVPLAFSNYRFGGDFDRYKSYVTGEETYAGEYEFSPELPKNDRLSACELEQSQVRSIRRNGLRVVSVRSIGVERVYDLTVEDNHNFYIITKEEGSIMSGVLVHNCSEITLYTDENHSFVCVLSSMNLSKWLEWKDWRSPRSGRSAPEIAIHLLEAVVSEFIKKAEHMTAMGRSVRFAKKSRALGLGTMGLHALYQSQMLPFKSDGARELNIEVHQFIREMADKASRELADRFGEPEWCVGSGFRHTHRLAIAPTKTNSVISGAYSEGIAPIDTNYYVAKQDKGTFVRKNPYLERTLCEKGVNDRVWDEIDKARGSVQNLDCLTDEEKEVFLTAREIDQFELIKQAADRQPFICQAQSLNLFLEDPNVSAEYLLKLHISAWKAGLKSLYYLKSKSALIANSNEEKIEEPAIIVTKPGCPWCDKLKTELSYDGIEYIEVPLEEAKRREMWREEWRTVPQLYLENQWVGGYTDYIDYKKTTKPSPVQYDETTSSYNECPACEA